MNVVSTVPPVSRHDCMGEVDHPGDARLTWRPRESGTETSTAYSTSSGTATETETTRQSRCAAYPAHTI
jgi:hypothetical protein